MKKGCIKEVLKEGATSSKIMKWEKNEELSLARWKQEKADASKSQDKAFL